MNCWGAMGPALIRSFPWIDAVVSMPVTGNVFHTRVLAVAGGARNANVPFAETGATPANIYLRLDEMDQGRTDMKKIYETLQLFILHKLAFVENDTYLSLALPEI